MVSFLLCYLIIGVFLIMGVDHFERKRARGFNGLEVFIGVLIWPYLAVMFFVRNFSKGHRG
jgi:hypothetical protein